MTSVLTKAPTSRSLSASVRPATGTPTAKLSCPVTRCNNASKAASKKTNGVTHSRLLAEPTASIRLGGQSSEHSAPRQLGAAGRGRASGKSSGGGKGVKFERQKPSSSS